MQKRCRHGNKSYERDDCRQNNDMMDTITAADPTTTNSKSISGSNHPDRVRVRRGELAKISTISTVSSTNNNRHTSRHLLNEGRVQNATSSRRQHSHRRRRHCYETQHQKKDVEINGKQIWVQQEVEAQLAKQRKQRQEKEAADEANKKQGAPDSRTIPIKRGTIMGSYIYDDSKKTYLPLRSVEGLYIQRTTTTRPKLEKQSTGDSYRSLESKDIRSNHHRTMMMLHHNGLIGFNNNKEEASIIMGDYWNLYRICPSSSMRHRLVSEWGAKLVLRSIEAQRLFFPYIESPSPATTTCSTTLLNGDGACWSRTFDVVYSNSFYPTNDEPVPTYLTVSNGILTVLRMGGHECIEARGIHYSSARFIQHGNEQTNSILSVGRGYNDTSQSIVRETFLDPSMTVSTAITLPIQVNDVIKVQCDGSVLVATNTDRTFRGKPWRLYFERPQEAGGCLNSLIHFPKSDVLCMATVTPTTVAFGHRSSQITLYDVRSNAVHALTGQLDYYNKNNGSSFGSVTKMLFNDHQRFDQLLVRGSGGYCRLYDLRMCTDHKVSKSSTSPTNTETSTSPSLVFELTTPESVHTIPGNLSWRCKGVATDSLNSTCLWPYVCEKGLSQLGVWSLHTGRFMGAKTIIRPPTLTTRSEQDNNENATWLELASTITTSTVLAGDCNFTTTTNNRSATQTKPTIWAKGWGYSSTATDIMYQIVTS